MLKVFAKKTHQTKAVFMHGNRKDLEYVRRMWTLVARVALVVAGHNSQPPPLVISLPVQYCNGLIVKRYV